jgi:hypothetical protein|tara:strand:- start:75 stop:245 length:171 start_codon:yes stop_codon:yes gene_type:complete
MSNWNVLGILFIIIGTTTLAVNLAFDVFVGDKIISILFIGMSAFMIIAGVFMGGSK